MLPGMKHLILMVSPSILSIGQTIVRPARFGSVITASSGTSIRLGFEERPAKPSANEQHSPSPDLSLLNHSSSSGWPGSWANAGEQSSSKIRTHYQAPSFTILKPLAPNSQSMALATCGLCSG